MIGEEVEFVNVERVGWFLGIFGGEAQVQREA